MTEPKPTYDISKMTNLEAAFMGNWIILANKHWPEHNYRFNPDRRWKMDFAWPDVKVCVECEGGIWVRGRHVRGKGFENDIEKYNNATARGWQVYRCTAGMLDRDPFSFVEVVRLAIERRSKCLRE